MHRGFRFLTCPDCKKAGVYPRRTNEDWWVCRYCRWSACMTHEDQTDRYERCRLATVNLQDVWVTDLSGPIERPRFYERADVDAVASIGVEMKSWCNDTHAERA